MRRISASNAQALGRAVEILALATDPNTPRYADAAAEVKTQFPKKSESLGVPTWFYGFEPTNVFATSIAKYFANSIREAGMLQIAQAGVMFAPGSAGTRQEVFMEAAQDHYGTTGYYSPMVFLGTKQYRTDAVYHFSNRSPKIRNTANSCLLRTNHRKWWAS